MERSVPQHLTEEDLERSGVIDIVRHGKLLFNAAWTDQDGAGRPLMKGTTRSLVDPSKPLSGMRSFNRFSAPDANSCLGCHNVPFGRRLSRDTKCRDRAASCFHALGPNFVAEPYYEILRLCYEKARQSFGRSSSRHFVSRGRLRAPK